MSYKEIGNTGIRQLDNSYEVSLWLKRTMKLLEKAEDKNNIPLSRRSSYAYSVASSNALMSSDDEYPSDDDEIIKLGTSTDNKRFKQITNNFRSNSLLTSYRFKWQLFANQLKLRGYQNEVDLEAFQNSNNTGGFHTPHVPQVKRVFTSYYFTWKLFSRKLIENTWKKEVKEVAKNPKRLSYG
ncbi:hypothetical protein TVAG_253820 [Trichomonas vaginalis G3]|uniref:Uncharacterized protein n=1 Tax=Trichomonas vaginalis (strain ATCC PRA-98 / G3) TaxID=412133 RepID=A2DMP9_TRIV3|nr:hypothetical protein TVAGG3_0059720 [Trichomonas vaginalis G3]EAY18270.1 hypothetical protein TVAG_253820 [Trichomonas vaginalis G3]KAI5541909.1 hypothetical protein TVAGG3_0059720 [Trichomonas vaginalis G3]|eukprot:XP_001579256.1 hypothetical protein [Trichomonas vaginalis G3]